MSSVSMLCSKSFPYSSKKACFKKNSVILGIGGNVGDVVKNFEKLFVKISKNRRFCIEESSFLLKNPPFGYINQPDFINAVLYIKTTLSYYGVLAYILYIERVFGRVRSFKNAPRGIDIDIIFFNNLNIKRVNLDIPHKKWSQRDSVTIPLSSLKKGRKCLSSF